LYCIGEVSMPVAVEVIWKYNNSSMWKHSSLANQWNDQKKSDSRTRLSGVNYLCRFI